MKKWMMIKTLISGALTLMLMTFAKADTPPQLDGIDLSPVVAYFQKEVKTLKKPIWLYNWSTNGADPFYQESSHIPQDILAAKVKVWSESFWKSYGVNGGYSYGYGLYGATDPISSDSFGGGGDGWLLLEMKIPEGMRLIDVFGDREREGAARLAMQKVTHQFDCPENISTNDFFVSGGVALSPRCQQLAKFLFKDLLKIDGFIYPYDTAQFKACQDESGNQYSAFVMMRPEWVDRGSIHFYNSSSRDKMQDRIRIQTLYLAAKQEKSLILSQAVLSKLKDYIMAHPDSTVEGSESRCEKDVCFIKVHLCDSENRCEDVTLDPVLRIGGSTITEEESKRWTLHGLLWKDLEGQPKQTTYKKWVIDHKYFCAGSPFEEKTP